MTDAALIEPPRHSTVRLSAMALGAIGVALLVLVLAVSATRHSGDPTNVHLGDGGLTFDASSPTTVAPTQKLTQQQLRQLNAAQNNGAQSPVAIIGIPYPVGQGGAQGGGSGGGGTPRSGGGGGQATVRTANGQSPPTISDFYANPSSPTPNQDIAFHWFAGDNDGIISAYTVDFGDGTKDGALTGNRCVADPADPTTERTPLHHKYAQIGTFRVHLKVFSAGSCGNGPTQNAETFYDITVTLVPGSVG
ncbi:MAG: hypothetical protein QOG03_1843 [Actinomycetota bacterium]|nr:hypothetical protein [Actinomycetota bacterium]